MGQGRHTLRSINDPVSAALRGPLLPVSLLTLLVSLNFIRSPLMLLFVNNICFKIHSLTPSLYILSTDTNFLNQNLIFVMNIMFTNTAVASAMK